MFDIWFVLRDCVFLGRSVIRNEGVDWGELGASPRQTSNDQ